MTSANLQRWAPVQPELAGKRPGLPNAWLPVLDKHPEGVAALPGYAVKLHSEHLTGGSTF